MTRPRFLFCPGGGIGDSIISLPALDFVIKHFAPYSDIDILTGFSKDTYYSIIGDRSNYISKFYDKCLPDDHPKYQASLSANEICHAQMGLAFYAMIQESNPEVMRLLRLGSERLKMFEGAETVQLNNYHFNHHEVALRAVGQGLTRMTLPQWSLGLDPPYIQPTLSTTKYSNSSIVDLPYITINDGWAGDSPFRITKSWSKEGWQDLVRLCRSEGIKIVQLGTMNNGYSHDVDLQLRGRLPFSQSLGILKASSCHVDIEGGLTHAAAALGTQSVVLFGPTNKEFFGYPQNINLTHDTCQGCWWSKPDWSDRCPKSNHICMKHDPEEVFKSVQTILERKNHGNTKG